LPAVNAQACTMPAETDFMTSPLEPKTGAGTFAGISISVATTASAPPPQQCGGPPCVTAPLKVLPADGDLKGNPPATGTGTELETFDPFPSCPWSLRPQQ